MIELPESQTIARHINETLIGKRVTSVLAASSPHKFAWYHNDPADYVDRLIGGEFLSARGIGAFVEISTSIAMLLFSEGVNLRWHPTSGPLPKKHQLLIGLDDETHLSASISMYGGLYCWEKGVVFDHFYYKTAREKPSPLGDEFDQAYFEALLSPEAVQKLSLKAALATQQRIPGLGNGCLQDILWHARVHPRRKTSTLSGDEVRTLFFSLKHTLTEMTRLGGRSTEKDLFGQPGGYPVVMCAANRGLPCPNCGTPIQKDSFLGGSITTCSRCQPLDISA